MQKVASVIAAQAKRDRDIVARYGGEEFILIFPGAKLEQAINMAESIRQAVLDLSLPHSASEVSPYVTLSLGVADVKQASTVTDLIKKADLALYDAKRKGRNCVAASSAA